MIYLIVFGSRRYFITAAHSNDLLNLAPPLFAVSGLRLAELAVSSPRAQELRQKV